MGRSIEQHMLQKMGDAALIIALVDGAGQNDKMQTDAVFGLGIRKHDIAESILQAAEDCLGVRSQVRAGMWPCRCRPRQCGRHRRGNGTTGYLPDPSKLCCGDASIPPRRHNAQQEHAKYD